MLFGFGSLFLSPGRIRKVAIAYAPRRSWHFIRRWCVARTADCLIERVPEEARTAGGILVGGLCGGVAVLAAAAGSRAVGRCSGSKVLNSGS